MPVLTATAAGVRHRRRWLFSDLDVTVGPGEVAAVVGPPGSGRTTVLLALTGRFRLSAGKVSLAGAAALGHVPAVEQPEPVLTVIEHVRERLALLGRSTRDAAAVDVCGLDPSLRGWQLTPLQRQLLGIVLARLAEPAVVGLDGVDDGLDAAEQAELWRVIDGLTGAGIAVVVTARDVDPGRVATVINLGAPAGKQSLAPAETGGGTPAGEPRAATEDSGAVEPPRIPAPRSPADDRPTQELAAARSDDPLDVEQAAHEPGDDRENKASEGSAETAADDAPVAADGEK